MPILLNPHCLAVAAPETLDITYQATYSVSSAPWATFADCDIGTASSSRRVIAVIYVNADNVPETASISAVTIGGVSATQLVRSNVGATTHADIYIWIADVPTGDTATIVATYTVNDGNPIYWICVDVYSMVGADASVAGTYSALNTTTVDARAGGVVVFGYGMAHTEAADDTSWTGATKDSYLMPGNYHKHTSAHYSAETTDATHAFTYAGAGPYGQGFAAVSLYPVA